ncbi:MAG: TGS domain-containing protein [Flavobacteriales bacterium]|nr:TGS domain-containing protein [Flavobacteriales bacterium]
MRVFTRKGEMRNPARRSNGTDLAFDIHTQIGRQCIGAKVNHKLVPLSHLAQRRRFGTGDHHQARSSSPRMIGWAMKTAKARHKDWAEPGASRRRSSQWWVERPRGLRRLRQYAKRRWSYSIDMLIAHFRARSAMHLYHQVARGKHDPAKIEGNDPRWQAGAAQSRAQAEERSLEEVVAEHPRRGARRSAHRLRPVKIDYQTASVIPSPGTMSSDLLLLVGEGIASIA